MTEHRDDKDDKKFPVIDTGQCSLCLGCASMAPKVFYLDENTGRMSVVSLKGYPVEQVEEAIKNCPKDCISWDRPIVL